MPKKKQPNPTLEKRVELRMSAKDKAAFQQAASRQRISFSLWLRLAAWRVINEHDGRVQLLDL
jgi:uncharacterized protein (DUF1778 family)